ncbi:MAG: NlpC/P60 family protein [Hyphomicrobiaceae bacterium]|nr:NlpC/P60 family protein [Hyphomicrobiaceae bacterium]
MHNDNTPPKALDRRTNAFRNDMAAEHLRDVVEAPHYVEGRVARVTAGAMGLHRGPDYDMPVETQIIFGDDVTVFDEQGNWAWVQNNRDGYVGYLPKGCLSSDMQQPTHKVIALSTFAYGKPDIKTPLPYKLFMNSRLRIVGEAGEFMKLADGRYLRKVHVGKLDDVADDFVSVAERYVEVPYLWGGRTADGLDCSGLVQLAYEFAGLSCPRDADMQMQLEGRDIDLGGMEEMQRGDLIFWKGHVAIMVNDMLMLHANAHHMKVCIEGFHKVVSRVAFEGGGDLTAILRPTMLSAGNVAG